MAGEVQPPGGLLPSAELIQTVALKMCSEKGVFHGSTAPCQWCLHDAANALAALEAADFVLLPSGGEVREDWAYRCSYDDTGHWTSRDAAQESARRSGIPPLRREVRTWPDGSQYIGPSEVVERHPVVSDTSEAPDG